jgi:integrase
VALYHNVLHRALDQAVKWQLLARNPCDAVDAPREAAPETATWNANEARAFLAAAVGHDLVALFTLALHTGMRRGELLGLRWQDVDLDRGALAVRRTMTRGQDGLAFGEPKSAAGRRALALPAPCVDALRSHRVRQLERRLQLGAAWQDTDLIFERGDGTLLHPNTVTYAFQHVAAHAGVPRIRFHDLRHTAATLMLANGEHPKIVQERLGHADISMTLNRYSHVSMDMQRDAADRLAALLAT